MSYGTKGGHGYGNTLLRKARRVQSRRSLHAKAIDDRLKTPKAVVWIDANPSSLSFVYGVCAVTAYRSIDLEV